MLNTIIATASRIRRALIFKTGQITSYVTGDDGDLEIGQAHNYEVLTTGQYSGTTAIVLNGKTETKSNACVMDHASGLMWSRTVSASVGPTSNGLLPWTTNANGEGIFTYAAAANAAAFAGYTNWRVPQKKELFGQDSGEPGTYVDPVAFPSIATVLTIWSSNTQKNNTANGIFCTTISGILGGAVKTATALVWLVRGPL